MDVVSYCPVKQLCLYNNGLCQLSQLEIELYLIKLLIAYIIQAKVKPFNVNSNLLEKLPF